MNIVLINVTPMDEAYRLWKQGVYPGHHLWGILELQRKEDFNCTILKHEKYKFFNKIGKFLNIQFLDQQIRTLFTLKKYDVIYAPYAIGNTKLLIILKLLKVIKTPVVVLVHQPLFGGLVSNNPIKKYILKKLSLQFDGVVFLSNKLKEDIIEKLAIPQTIADKKFYNLNWGPEMKFYKNYQVPQHPADGSFVISAGHTDRDFDTLIEAFRYIKFPLKIFCTPSSLPKTKDIPEHIEIISKAGFTSYFDLLSEYNKARLIIIPVGGVPAGTQGLTSLLDVLAMGKPVIMTKNPNVDLNIDKEGIGISVNPGSVEEMRDAVNSILFDYERLKQMGDTSLKLMKERYNMSVFADGLADVFTQVCQTTRSKSNTSEHICLQ